MDHATLFANSLEHVSLWMEYARLYGPLGLAFVYFLWRDWRRETHANHRTESLEQERMDILVPLIEKTSAVVAQNTELMNRNTKVMERNTEVMARNLEAMRNIDRHLGR